MKKIQSVSGLMDGRAPDLSIDEIAHLLEGEIIRLKATSVGQVPTQCAFQ
ncbi:hypothetical protein ACYZT8_16010 [Pseudomonas sp. LB3P93]